MYLTCTEHFLMERHSFCPEETLFVGNDSRTDIAGAAQVGMRTEWSIIKE